MLPHLLTLLLLAQGPAPQAPEIQARVPGTYVAVSLRLDRYADDEAMWRQAATDLGEKAILFGDFGRGTRAAVSITAEKQEKERLTSEERAIVRRWILSFRPRAG